MTFVAKVPDNMCFFFFVSIAHLFFLTISMEEEKLDGERQNPNLPSSFIVARIATMNMT